MESGKIYQIERLDPRGPYDRLEWVFVWDHPHGGNHVVDKLPVGKPYMFIENQPDMSVWCKILYDDKIGWIYLRKQPIKEITDNGG